MLIAIRADAGVCFVGTGSMETTKTNLDASRAKWRSDIERTRKLIRLYPDQHDHAVSSTLNHACEAKRIH
jgi:hypothetical protein